MKTRIFFLFIIGMMVLSLWQPQRTEAQARELYREGHFVWTVWRTLENGQVLVHAMIVDYTGPGGSLQIPSVIDGLPVVAILDEAFFGKGLTSVSIPSSVIGIESVPGIGTRAFDSNQLTSISLPNGITYIGTEAFAGNQLTAVAIPNGVTHIGAYAFAENSLTRVNMPSSVTHIGEGAFSGNQLTNVAIPSRVISIGAGAFFANRLTSVIVPSGAQIGANAFARNGANGESEASVTRR